MSKNIYVFLSTGFEEIEAVATIDLLRRAGLSTVIVSVEDKLSVYGSHNICICADKHISEINWDDAEALVLPGGSLRLGDCPALMDAIVKHQQSGRLLAAICAAPALLARQGLLEGRAAIVYPGMEEMLTGAVITEQGVVVSDNIITARGPGYSLDFGLAIVHYLLGEQATQTLSKALLYPH